MIVSVFWHWEMIPAVIKNFFLRVFWKLWLLYDWSICFASPKLTRVEKLSTGQSAHLTFLEVTSNTCCYIFVLPLKKKTHSIITNYIKTTHHEQDLGEDHNLHSMIFMGLVFFYPRWAAKQGYHCAQLLEALFKSESVWMMVLTLCDKQSTQSGLTALN